MMTIVSTAYESCDIDYFGVAEDYEGRVNPTYISPQLIYQPSTSSNNNMMENYYTNLSPTTQGPLPDLEVEEEIIESIDEDYEMEEEEEEEEIIYVNPVQVLRARRQKLVERTTRESSSPTILPTISESESSQLNADDPIEEPYLEDAVSISSETSSSSSRKKREIPSVIQDKLEIITISLKDRFYKPIISSPLARFSYDPSIFVEKVIVMNLIDAIEVGDIEEMGMDSFINYSGSEDDEAGEDDLGVEGRSNSSPSPTISGRYRMWSEKDLDQVMKEEQEEEEQIIGTVLEVKVNDQVQVEESIAMNTNLSNGEEDANKSNSFSNLSTLSNRAMRTKYPSKHRRSSTVTQVEARSRLTRALRLEMESETRDPWCEM